MWEPTSRTIVLYAESIRPLVTVEVAAIDALPGKL
mgnify:CR=1 FL=1